MQNIDFEFLNGKSSYIMHAKNAISRDVCHGLVSECMKYYEKIFSPGPTIGGVNPYIKNSMDFNFSRYSLSETDIPLEPFGSYEDSITESLFASVSYYVNQYRELWNWPGIRDTGFRLQRYIKNYGFYRQHVDGNPWGRHGTEDRVLAAVVYLNDVHKGGETYFPEHDVCIPAIAGDIGIFPAAWTHPHQGNTPIGSDKWIISTFYLCDTIDYSGAKEENEAGKKEIISDVEQLEVSKK
jgi:hypothetical protein